MPNYFSQFTSNRGPRVASVTRRNQPRRSDPVDVQGLLSQLQSRQDEFNQTGLERYRALMDHVGGVNERVLGEGGTFAQAEGLLSGMGQSQRRRIGEAEREALGATEQDLTTRGLGNTTIRTNARRAVRQDAEDARQDLAERVATARSGLLERRAGTEVGLGQLTGDFMLSREDVPPNVGQYAGLLQQLAASGGTAGGMGIRSGGGVPGGGGGGGGSGGGGSQASGGGGGHVQAQGVQTHRNEMISRTSPGAGWRRLRAAPGGYNSVWGRTT